MGIVERLCGLTWREILRRVYREFWEDEIFGRAAQLSFYILFALFPLLLFVMVLLGYLAEAGSELRALLLQYFDSVVPETAAGLIHEVLDEISRNASTGKLSFGLAVALWTASTGMGAVMTTLNIAYDIDEQRPWWKWRLVAMLLTLLFSIFTVLALGLVLYGGRLADATAGWIGISEEALVLKLVRWGLVLLFVLVAFCLIYRLAPNLKRQRLKWIVPGAVVAMALWLLVSFGFRFYLRHFGSYDQTYGSVGAVIALLFWLYLTSTALLVGGEVNSEIEHAAVEHGATDAHAPGEHEPGELNDRGSGKDSPAPAAG